MDTEQVYFDDDAKGPPLALCFGLLIFPLASALLLIAATAFICFLIFGAY